MSLHHCVTRGHTGSPRRMGLSTRVRSELPLINEHWDCGLTPGVSCAAGRRVRRGGPRHEAAARQGACGRPMRRRVSWVAGSVWRLGDGVMPAGRSGLAG